MIDVCAGCGFETRVRVRGPRRVGKDGLLTSYPGRDFPEKSEHRLCLQHALSDEEEGEDGGRECVCLWPMLIPRDVVNVERVTKSSRLDANLHSHTSQSNPCFSLVLIVWKNSSLQDSP